MKTSRKAKRIRRHYGRMHKPGGLNLMSLAVGSLAVQVTAEAIMAGRDTDYRLLRKVMQTCVDEQYRRVRLAVEGEVRNG
ncbi:hypothetical protein SAMN04487881_2291 [Marinobacter sp. es.048]|uniref:hypothetical protein n=1 Tax=Marinobacter sp. es.048 TaxID=1761795 RepID=UPI000B597EB7|nr:hypothetical protein [Marinobacter sp. es.048]SNC74392.1 hypothetical protein SAMN04487881_2291 [Marinobacter sp. es.048]